MESIIFVISVILTIDCPGPICVYNTGNQSNQLHAENENAIFIAKVESEFDWRFKLVSL